MGGAQVGGIKMVTGSDGSDLCYQGNVLVQTDVFQWCSCTSPPPFPQQEQPR